jgi:hypothetical protein
MIMLNSILYTFSTIAQAIAGAIGLLGAFVLFKLHALSAQIETLAEKLAGPLGIWAQSTAAPSGADRAIRDLFLEGKYQELLDHSGWDALPKGVYDANLEREKLPRLLASKRLLVGSFKWSLYLTVSLILVSGVALATSQPIAARPCLSVFMLGLGLVWLLVCLMSYVVLMHRALT